MEQEVLDELKDGRIANSALSRIPSDEEVLETIGQMKDSAAGVDQVRMGMIKNGGERVLAETCRLVQEMWGKRHWEWEEVVKDCELVPLYKGKGGREEKAWKALECLGPESNSSIDA